MELSKSEKKMLCGVLAEVLSHTDELHKRFGSITIEEMDKLYWKLKFSDYCARHNINYEDMTEDDYMRYYYEENEE